MINSEKTCSIVNEIASALTQAFTTRVQTRGEGCFEICLDKCILRVTFERYEPEISSVVFVDPFHPTAEPELHLWIMTRLPGVAWRLVPGDHPYFSYGQAILEHFPNILEGDFSVRETYKHMKNKILDEQELSR